MLRKFNMDDLKYRKELLSNIFPKVISNIISKYDYFLLGEVEFSLHDLGDGIYNIYTLSDGSIVTQNMSELKIYKGLKYNYVIKIDELQKFRSLKIFPNDNILIYNSDTIIIFDNSGIQFKTINIDFYNIVNIEIISNTLFLIFSEDNRNIQYINIYDLNSEINTFNNKIMFKYMNKYYPVSDDKFIIIYYKISNGCPDGYVNFSLYKINNRKIENVFEIDFENVNKINTIETIHELSNGNIILFGLSDKNDYYLSIFEGKVLKEKKYKSYKLEYILINLIIGNKIILIGSDILYILDLHTLEINKTITLYVDIKYLKYYTMLTTTDILIILPQRTIMLNPFTGEIRELVSYKIFKYAILPDLKLVILKDDGKIEILI